MRIEGYIYDINNKPITAIVTATHPSDGSIGILEILPGEKYYIDGEIEYLKNMVVIFSSKGYRSVTTTGRDLMDTGTNIHLQKQNIVWLLLIAMGLFYVLYNKKKKVGALSTKEIIPFIVIGAAVLGFSLIKQLLESLGVWKDKDDRALDDAATNANSFWNPNYWKTLPTGQEYTNPITTTTANSYADKIYNSFGPFNDCEECVKAVFKLMPSQAAASFVSNSFNNKYGDMLDFLRGGVWPQDRLSSGDVNEINQYVSTLPKY